MLKARVTFQIGIVSNQRHEWFYAVLELHFISRPQPWIVSRIKTPPAEKCYIQSLFLHTTHELCKLAVSLKFTVFREKEREIKVSRARKLQQRAFCARENMFAENFIFSHYWDRRKERKKLHCDVYLSIIRQNDLVDISFSVWTVAFPFSGSGEEIKIHCLFLQHCAKWSRKEIADTQRVEFCNWQWSQLIEWTANVNLPFDMIHCFLIVAQKPCIF